MKRSRTRRWVRALPGLGGVSAFLIGSVVGCSSGPPPHAHGVAHEPAHHPAPAHAPHDEVSAMRAELAALQAAMARPGAGAPGDHADHEHGAAPADAGNEGARLASKQYYEQALQAWEGNNFAAALDNADRALQAWPGNEQAAELRNRIALALGEEGSVQQVKDWYEQTGRVMIQQAQAEVQVNFEKGVKAFEARDMRAAVEAFEKCKMRFDTIPYEIGLPEIREELPQRLALARKGLARQEEEIAGMQRMAAERLAQQEADREVGARRAKIRQMFEQALVHFEERRYKYAEELCNNCLAIDPDFRLAKDLKVDAMRAYHNKTYATFLKTKIERWKQTLEDIDEATTPYADDDLVRWPAMEYWDQVRQRQPLSTIQEEQAADEDVLAIQRVLDNTKIDLDFTDASLEDIIGFIREYAKINIEIDQKVREEGLAEKKITFQMREAVLRNVLNLLLRQYSLGYTFDHKVLLIVKQDQAEGAPVVVVHDVRDLLRPISDFVGPSISLTTGEGEESSPTAAFELAEEPRAPLTGDQLTKLIQDNIDPASWQERSDTVSITLSAQGQLIVVHTPRVQQEVQQFLQNLRSFTGSMVSIETRFLTVSDNFLEDVGVDWRGFNGVPTTPGLARADGLTDADQSGLFAHSQNSSGGGYDFRFQQLLTYRNPAKGGRNDFVLGQDLQNTGGLGLQYAFLGDPARKLILRALTKQEKATQVSAPRVTAFNAQRAHILVAEQQAYIQDYDVEIATAAAAYDPIIGIVQDGLVLDVRPIISNDRKYITLEMRPTLANLTELRLFDITPDQRADDPANPDTYLQLPKLELQRAQTTVRMPDKGSILIAGLKNVLDRDLRVETPFLADIPLLGFLFKREGKSLERSTLLILVTAEIIDLGEREADKAGFVPPSQVPLPEDRPVFHRHDIEQGEYRGR